MTNLENDIQLIFLDTFPNMKTDEFNLDKKQEDYDDLYKQWLNNFTPQIQIQINLERNSQILAYKNGVNPSNSHLLNNFQRENIFCVG